MLPALMMIGCGKSKRVWIPLPLFLLWPFWLLGWGVWLVLWFFRADVERALRVALTAGLHLKGTQVDVDAADGTQVHIRLV
jgi:hypothetical protein